MTWTHDDCEEFEEHVRWYQKHINSGDVWRFEGSVGREAMGLIEAGYCCLGEKGCYDFWGNYVPSRYEVEPGTKGSVEYMEER